MRREPVSNDATNYLLALAKRNAQAYIALPDTKAIIATGSVAEGISDYYSDIDMIIYYDKVPSEEELIATYHKNQGQNRKLYGETGQEECMEIYQVNGVECQMAHTSISAWERDIAVVLEQLNVTSPLQKALSGLLEAVPLYGEELIRFWQKRISNYPDALAQAMVKHYLVIVPLWTIYSRIEMRDATIWRYELLVEAAYHLLGMLAGLNHLYYSSFQFKRMQRFIAQMHIVPSNCAARIEALFHEEAQFSIMHLQELVQEVVALIEQHMPEIDTTVLKQNLAKQQQEWMPF